MQPKLHYAPMRTQSNPQKRSEIRTPGSRNDLSYRRWWYLGDFQKGDDPFWPFEGGEGPGRGERFGIFPLPGRFFSPFLAGTRKGAAGGIPAIEQRSTDNDRNRREYEFFASASASRRVTQLNFAFPAKATHRLYQNLYGRSFYAKNGLRVYRFCVIGRRRAAGGGGRRGVEGAAPYSGISPRSCHSGRSEESASLVSCCLLPAARCLHRAGQADRQIIGTTGGSESRISNLESRNGPGGEQRAAPLHRP